jgi:hypothetical protein
VLYIFFVFRTEEFITFSASLTDENNVEIVLMKPYSLWASTDESIKLDNGCNVYSSQRIFIVFGKLKSDFGVIN